MRSRWLVWIMALGHAGTVQAAQIRGDYLEARSCDVYTGPCFANAEMDLAGKEATIAWRVDEGTWQGVQLDGLCAVLVVVADKTLGDTGVFPMKARQTQSVLLLDDKSSARQREALQAFVKAHAGVLAQNIVRVETVPIQLEQDHVSGIASLQAGTLACIKTRGIKQGDCVCTNEQIFYKPLAKVYDYQPAYTLTHAYLGTGLGINWENHGQRSAFLATFRR